MLRGALLAAFLLCIAPVAHAGLGRDDQWSYVAANIEHGARAELRGDYPEGVPSLMIIQVECLRETRSILVRHDYDEREFIGPYPADVPFQLVVDGQRTINMRHLPPDGVSVRRLSLSAEIVGSIEAAEDFELYTPSESGHAWRLGRAPAFRRVVRECWAHALR